jgi:hypothetical protein
MCGGESDNLTLWLMLIPWSKNREYTGRGAGITKMVIKKTTTTIIPVIIIVIFFEDIIFGPRFLIFLTTMNMLPFLMNIYQFHMDSSNILVGVCEITLFFNQLSFYFA